MGERRLRTFLLIAALAVCAVQAQADQLHLEYPGSTTYGPTTFDSLDKSMEEAARELRQQQPQGADRFAAYDMAYPADAVEYKAFGKHAIVLVSAVSHDVGELPLARVYIRVGGREISLKPILAVRRDTQEGSATRAMFGQYRADAFYFVPISLLAPDAKLICDFAANRKGFTLGTVDVPDLDFIVSDRDRTSSREPSFAALKAFMDREYPGIVFGK